MTVQAADPPAVEPAADAAQGPTAPQLTSSTLPTKRKRTEDTPAAAAAVTATAAVGAAAAKKRHEADSTAQDRTAAVHEPGQHPVPSSAAAAARQQQQQQLPPEAEGSQGSHDDSEGSQEQQDDIVDVDVEQGSESGGEGEEPRSHPYGVRPWGNFYMSQQPEIRTAGLGVLAGLSDDVLLGLLELLPAADLARLGLVSQALYCFAHTNDLWKALVLQELGGNFDWCGSWRETYLAHAAPGYKLGSHKPLQVAGFYSDFLHQPWFCATVPLQPEWLEVDNIDRRSGLSPESFRSQYECRNRPVLLTDGAADWPALHKWSQDYLAAAFAGRPVIVGNASWRFGSYLSYCRNGSELDEMPLYMFDKAFASACPHLVGDYRVPAVFSEDLFEVLGEDRRPDYRWMIIGPHRSGSSFHVDPNATCAWNAVVSGAKKWILFPPGSPPPGVHPSPDGADVAAPVSIIEWFLNFYDEARNSKRPPVECICRPGEVLYVPRGWWHCVLNLGHTVAVTQNFVSSVGLPKVLDFLKPGRTALVSGCGLEDRSSLHDRFVAALEQQRPQVLAAVRQQQQQQHQQREAEHRLSVLFKSTRHQEQQQDVKTADQEQQELGQQQRQQQQEGGPSAGFSFGFSLNGGDSCGQGSAGGDGGGATAPAATPAAAAGAGAGAGDVACQGFSFGFSLPSQPGPQ